ncbi:hypothetical protein [Pseudodesulfovibrio indicus]|uniref:hypothetical protein n=1 Tax=Pseudodesulfovibrio indicus TaxID=1716143 RepID=UPI0029309E29|nr:hypothetical protein [Pseudodesulfovibrio indicus]
MRRLYGVRNIVLVAVACLALAACVAGKKAKGPGAYALEQDVPQIVAVLPAGVELARAATEGGEVDPADAEFVGGLARSVLRNQLAGKGYLPKLDNAVDRRLHDNPGWRDMDGKALCALLDVQGVVYIDISGWTMVNAAAVETFMLSAGARMVSASGREVGNWTETAEKQKFSIPTSLVGLVGTLAGAFLSDSPQKQFRHVAYDWGWKMAQIMPDCLEGRSLPEIMLVDSNVDVGVFGAGDKVAVKVFAEKDLVASFDIGDFRKDIPLKMVGEGEYEGFYLVRDGDKTSGQPLTVRVARLNGAEREWIEGEALISLDGVPPSAPEKPVYRAESDGVHMAWQLPGGEEVAAFVVERNDSPVGEFTRIARTEDAAFVDGEVEQGRAYFYRIRSVDGARNLSAPGKPAEVVMPRFDELAIGGELTGTLITGNYRVERDSSVPAGQVLTIMRGSRLIFADGAGLTVAGRLAVKGAKDAPVVLTGERWRGVTVAGGGGADLTGMVLSGCATAVSSAGLLRMEGVDAKGEGGDGVVLSGGAFELKDVDLTGWARGVSVTGGEGVVAESALTGNETGVAYSGGELVLDHNNIHQNGRNIDARRQLAVRANFLGATTADKAGVSEQVILKSVLDAPWPDGRVIALMEDEDLSAEQITKRFEEHKACGIELFNQRKYGDALVELAKAGRYGSDRDASLYTAYALMELGEKERAGKTLESAIKAFPYDFRLRQVYVRYLLGSGDDAKALAVVDEAVRMDPGNENLTFLREYVIEETRRMRTEASARSR